MDVLGLYEKTEEEDAPSTFKRAKKLVRKSKDDNLFYTPKKVAIKLYILPPKEEERRRSQFLYPAKTESDHTFILKDEEKPLTFETNSSYKLNFYDFGGYSSVSLKKKNEELIRRFKHSNYFRDQTECPYIPFELDPIERNCLIQLSKSSCVNENFKNEMAKYFHHQFVNSFCASFNERTQKFMICAHVIHEETINIKITADIIEYLNTKLRVVGEEGKKKYVIGSLQISHHEQLNQNNYVNIYKKGFGNNNVRASNIHELIMSEQRYKRVLNYQRLVYVQNLFFNTLLDDLQLLNNNPQEEDDDSF